MMVTLTLHRNYDEGQPVTFRARTMTNAEAKLVKWMNKNNGAFDPRSGTFPMGCDGLAVFLNDWPGNVVLAYDEFYKEWEINFDEDPANPESYTDWNEARERFVKLAGDWGEWEES